MGNASFPKVNSNLQSNNLTLAYCQNQCYKYCLQHYKLMCTHKVYLFIPSLNKHKNNDKKIKKHTLIKAKLKFKGK